MSFPTAMNDRNVCVVGLGYVGLTLAAAMADSGFRVHGLEVRDEVLNGLADGQPHFWEPRLKEKLERVICSGKFIDGTHGVYRRTVHRKCQFILVSGPK